MYVSKINMPVRRWNSYQSSVMQHLCLPFYNPSTINRRTAPACGIFSLFAAPVLLFPTPTSHSQTAPKAVSNLCSQPLKTKNSWQQQLSLVFHGSKSVFWWSKRSNPINQTSLNQSKEKSSWCNFSSSISLQTVFHSYTGRAQGIVAEF